MNTAAGTGLFLGRTNGLRYRGKKSSNNARRNSRRNTSLRIKPSKQAEWNAMTNVDRNYVIGTPALRMEFEENSAGNNLFGARNRTTVKRDTSAILSALANLGERMGTLEAAQARGLNAAERIEVATAAVQNTAAHTLSLAREINAGVQQTLTISQQTLAVVNKIKNGMGLSGGPASYMTNPWFALIVSYILHPYFPVSLETIMPLWGVLLSGSYVFRTAPQLLRGESPISLSGSLLGTARSLIFSQPNAIFLMFSLSRMWTQDRLGTTDPQAALEFKMAMESSNLEPFLADKFVKTMEGLQEMNIRSLNGTLSLPTANLTDIQNYLSSIPENVYNEIVAMNPEMWKDKAGCIQLITEYLAGKLSVVAGGVVRTLGAPGHLYQINTVQRAELYLIECAFNLTKQIFYETGKKVLNYTQGYICGVLCAFAAIKPASSGGFFSSWVPTPASILQKSTEFITSFVCDCDKMKMDGGRYAPVMNRPLSVNNSMMAIHAKNTHHKTRNNLARRNKTRNNAVVKKFAAKLSADHFPFIKLSFNYTMLNLAPFFGIPLDANSQSYSSLEQEMRQLFVHKLETGQFVPPFYFEDFNILSAYPKQKLL